MANLIIPANQMIEHTGKKAMYALDPLNRWHQLNSKCWAFDIGLQNAINPYYMREKRYKTLANLLGYMDEGQAEIVIAYYGFPDDLRSCLGYSYESVAAANNWKGHGKTGIEQMDFFPYEIIYQHWEEIGKPKY